MRTWRRRRCAAVYQTKTSFSARSVSRHDVCATAWPERLQTRNTFEKKQGWTELGRRGGAMSISFGRAADPCYNIFRISFHRRWLSKVLAFSACVKAWAKKRAGMYVSEDPHLCYRDRAHQWLFQIAHRHEIQFLVRTIVNNPCA